MTATSSNANGVQMQYGYDVLNRLQTVDDLADPQQPSRTLYQFDDVGNLGNVTAANGVMNDYIHDALNRPTNVLISNTIGDVLASFDYTMSPSGQRGQIVEITGRTANYQYDSLYRLTRETITGDPAGNTGVVNYSLDPVGNRLTRTSTLPGVGNQFNAYDANGNTITGTVSASEPQVVDEYDFEKGVT